MRRKTLPIAFTQSYQRFDDEQNGTAGALFLAESPAVIAESCSGLKRMKKDDMAKEKKASKTKKAKTDKSKSDDTKKDDSMKHDDSMKQN
jgi:hypothetical protein